MSALRSCLPLVLVAWAWSPAAGDPLPTGAVARLVADRDGYKFLSFSADGKRLVAVQTNGTIRVWDLATRKEAHSVPFEQRMAVWAMSSDRSTLIGVDDRLTVYRFSLAADRSFRPVPLGEARELDIGLRPQEAHLLPDGTLALLAEARGADPRLNRFGVSFWNLATGKLVRWGGDPGIDFRPDHARLSPDGRLTAALESTFDTRTGTRTALPASPFGLGGVPVFSPDGRLLAVPARDTRVWELATGRVVADLPFTSTGVAAFSPDGRRLAAAADEGITVWDVGRRKAVSDRPMPSAVAALTFSPDGRTLATGHPNGTVFLWPVPAPEPPGRWSPSDANEAWDALGGDPSASGYPVVWQLADHPAEVVRFLRTKVAINPTADPRELTRLVAGLDSPRFAEREAASKRLRELGRAAEGPLRRELRRELSPEQVARVEGVLAGLEPVARPRGDDLRGTRAVAVLEHVGTEEARRVLAEWAERAASPNVADEAGRALARLKARR